MKTYTHDDIMDAISEEVGYAEAKHPQWPLDPFHALAVAQEELGETTKAMLDHVYHGKDKGEIRKEAIQSAASIVRFLENFESYDFGNRYE